MRIGVYPAHPASTSARHFPFHILNDPRIAGAGITVSFLASSDELGENSCDCLHIIDVDEGTHDIVQKAHELNIPFVVSPVVAVRYPSWFVRTLVAGGSLAGGISSQWKNDFIQRASVCSYANRVIPRNAQQAKIIEKGFGIRKENIVSIPQHVDNRFVDAEPRLFTQQFGVDRFIFADAMGGNAETNIMRLIFALEKINHPALILRLNGITPYAQQCRAIANNNPRLRLVNLNQHDTELYYSAFAACEVYVDVSPEPIDGAAIGAAAAGAKIVVSKHGGMEEYFSLDAEYIEPTSWELIHHGITASLNKPQTISLRDRMREHHSFGRSVEALQSTYKSIIR